MKPNLYTIALCIAAASVTGCTKLDNKVYSEIIAQQFQPSGSDILRIAGSAYTPWRTLAMDGDGLVEMQDVTSDQIVVAAKPWGWYDGGAWRRMHLHTWNAENFQIVNFWNKTYTGITNCNQAIYQIESGLIPVTTGKENILAELKVLRASYYYLLCDLFGNVPYVTRFDIEPGFLPEQITRKALFDSIVNEVTAALPLLSNAVDQSTYGRFTRYGAHALLAKMYLNAGVYTGANRWHECIQHADSVILSGKFALDVIQRATFSYDNEKSKEAVFAVPYDEKRATGNVLYYKTLNGQHERTFDAKAGGGWGGTTMVPQFIDSYDPDDTRLEQNHIYGTQRASDGTVLTNSFGPVAGTPFVIYNDVPSVDSALEIHGYRQAKYEYKMGNLGQMSNDYFLFRYTDILMMKAECLLRTGQADAAATIVSEIRARSCPGNPGKALVTGSQLTQGSTDPYGKKELGVMLTNEGGDDIQYGRFLDELGWEFEQEGRRRQDLIRFGVFTTKSWLSHTPSGQYKTLFPIPQAELNKNPNLKQNDGY